MHDASHRLISKSKTANDLFGIVSGTFCLLPYLPWRDSHLQHHYWSGNIEKDPVMAFLIKYPKMSLRKKTTLTKIWKSWLPVLGIIQNIVFWSLAIKSWQKQKTSGTVAISLAIPAIAWISILILTSVQFQILVLFPGLLIYFVAVEVVNLPHHLQLPYFTGDIKQPAWNQHLTARTCIYPNWVARLITLNFNYHIEHHMFPDAPWYELDKLHQHVAYHLAGQYKSDPYFEWIKINKKNEIKTVLYGDHPVLSEQLFSKKSA